MQIPQKFKESYLFEEKVIAKKAVLHSILNIDTIVFDIDGVLIDVHASFRIAVCLTVQCYFKEVLKYNGSEELILPDEIKYFKMAGGFNNDWDLTSAVILHYLTKAAKYKTKDLGILRKQKLDLETYCYEILPSGGGLTKCVELIRQDHDVEEEILSQWNEKLVIQLFKEIYAGVEHCFDIYHFNPSIIKTSGLCEKEKIILDENLNSFLKNYSIGILTGRCNAEAKMALENLKLNDLLTENQVMTAEKVTGKPHPEGLIKLSSILKTGLGLYIGDILDDLQTAKNYNKENKKSGFLSALVLGGELNEKELLVLTYMDKGVDLLAKDVNELLYWMANKAK